MIKTSECDNLLEELIKLRAMALQLSRNLTDKNIADAECIWNPADALLIKRQLSELRAYLDEPNEGKRC